MSKTEDVKDKKKELETTILILKKKLSQTDKYNGEQLQVFFDQLSDAQKELKELKKKDIKIVPNMSSNIVADHVDVHQSHLVNNKFYL